MKKRKTLYLWGLLLLYFGVLNSCRNDYLRDVEQRNEHKRSGFVSKIISLNESTHRERLKAALNNAKQLLNDNTQTTVGKSVNYGDSVTIDTDHVIYTENGNYYNYIFALEKTSPIANAPVDNLLLTPLPDGTYKEFLIQYYITEQEQQLLRNSDWKVPNNKIKVSELLPGTYNNGQLLQIMSQSCTYVSAQAYTFCGSGDHYNGEGSGECHVEPKSQLITVFFWQCESIEEPPPPGSPPPSPGTPGDTPGGGDGTLCPDCPPTEPTECIQIPTDPLEPSTGIGDGGCVMGIPTIPNLGDPKPQTPCEKTKETYENTAVKSRYEILKGKTSEPSESGYGFKTVLDGNGGTTTQTNLLNPDITDPSKMIVSIFPTSYGYIHTHLDKTDDKISVKIFSPADINTFIAFLHNAKANSTQLGNIFGGMIASDPDTGHNIYQIHYTGDGSDLPAIFTKEQVKVLKAEYTRMAQRTANDNEGVLYHSDLQKLFYKFLKKMNLNNVALTKIEDNPKKFKKVNFDANGNPTEENCP